MSDVITAECPHCSTQLRVKGDGTVGKKVRCPRCKEPFTVQAPKRKTVSAPARSDEDNFMSLLDTAVKDSVRREAIPREPEELAAAQKRLTSQWGVTTAPRSLADVRDDDEDGGIMSKLGPFGWVLGGMIGGGFGACIWAAIGYSTGVESGWIAMGIGGLAGAGVRLGAGDRTYGMGPGITAVLIALFSITIGKFLVAHMLVDQYVKELQGGGTPEEVAMSGLEDEVRETLEDAGMSPTNKDVKNEAKRRWEAMPPDEQQAKIDSAKREMEASGIEAGKAVTVGVVFFLFMINPLNVIYFPFAGFAAYKIGAGFGD